MVSSRRQISPCPVCNRTDQVRKMQTAYEAGELHVTPPAMPESHASMMKYIGIGMILVGIAAFLLIIMLSTGSFSMIQLVLSLLCIVAALVLSFMAIRHIGQGDEEARRRYPVWDLAMANWTRLRFCTRDKVIFDPQSNKVLSDSAVKTLLDMDRMADQSTPTSRVAVTH